MAFKKYKKIKNIIAGSALVVSSLTGPSVFADEEILPIPISFDQRPQFELSIIDLTNNKLDFGFNPIRIPGAFSNFGAWIVDDSGVDDIADLKEESLTQAFWSNDEDVSTFRKYTLETTNHYVVSSEVNLAEKSTGKMLTMAKLSNGTVWASLVDFSNCLAGWELGKACSADTFEKDSSNYVTSINYVLTDVEIEETEDDGSDDADSSNSDNPDDGSSTDDDNTDDSDDNDSEDDTDNEDDTESTSDGDSDDATNAETDEDANSNSETVVTTAVKTAAVTKTTGSSNNSKTSTNTSSTSSDTSDNNSDVIGDTSEIAEGSGGTTLDVPMLGGGSNKVNETVDNLSWILIFLSGMLAGTTGTWFLLSRNRKTDRRE